jgi:hypothetical protein
MKKFLDFLSKNRNKIVIKVCNIALFAGICLYGGMILYAQAQVIKMDPSIMTRQSEGQFLFMEVIIFAIFSLPVLIVMFIVDLLGNWLEKYLERRKCKTPSISAL